MSQFSRVRGWLARGLAAALALVVCGGALDWGHVGGDDPDCSVVLIQRDNTAPRIHIATSSQSQPAGHCYICHALWLLHAALKVRDAHAHVELLSTQWSCPADRVFARRALGLALSSRAPPSIQL
jgi:hypothetical protein